MNRPFGGVQRIVLQGANWRHARHLALDFRTQGPQPPHFLCTLQERHRWPTTAGDSDVRVQASLGFTRRGLEHAGVPAHVLACFALKAPAFHAGAAMRAGRHLGMVGAEAPGEWEPGFAFSTLDAVLSLHAEDEASLDRAAQQVQDAAKQALVPVHELQKANRLDPHPPRKARDREMWIHFGFRDGLARVGIKGWTDRDDPEALKAAFNKTSIHEAGEFVLGHVQNAGGNPWIAGPGQRVWTEPLRNFFRDGSFGVLQQIEQHVKAFEDFIHETTTPELDAQTLKAKLCGRFPDGRPVGTPGAAPEADFDYADDARGEHCPFGAHVRRMNPRESDPGVAGARDLAHFSRARPLLRRGLPYGPVAWGGADNDDSKRGLMGQFFCASIEDQYEHLVGQWGDRVPLGSPDRGGARDPFWGGHEDGDGPFEIPRPHPQPSLMLKGLRPFTRTRGVAYLFYPSASTLEGIAKSEPWLEIDEDPA